jgi:hypothetical protein
MIIRKLLVGGVVAASLVAGAVGVSITSATAAPQPPVAGSTTIANGARLTPSPGQLLTAGNDIAVKVAGETFGGFTVPADATGVILSVSNNQSAGAGQLRVWTDGKPGTPTIEWAAGKVATASITVGVDTAGMIRVGATTNTRWLAAMVGVVRPLPAPAAPVVKQIPAVATKTLDVGGSIRTRATTFAEITLPAGTYSVSARGTFYGLNNTNNTVPAGVFLTGTMLIQKGADMGANFENNITVGGILVHRSASDTLTQDATAAITDTLVLTAETKLTVKFMGYASNSSQAGSGELKASFQGATFVKIA